MFAKLFLILFFYFPLAVGQQFTFAEYSAFLKTISDTGKFRVYTLNEFRTTYDNNHILIGLRHDVDENLNRAVDLSSVELSQGIRSTYFILHSASYYTKDILPVLKKLQGEGFEIGFHNDLVTLQIVYKMDPVEYLREQLSWLRDNGIRITGTASHGSNYCYTYSYLNYYIFEDFSEVVHPFDNNISINRTPITKAKLNDFFEYEASHLDIDKYFSDCAFIDSHRWHPSMVDWKALKPGDRVQILIHPEWWNR